MPWIAWVTPIQLGCSKSWPFVCTNPDLCGFAMILGPQNWRGGGLRLVPACVCAGLDTRPGIQTVAGRWVPQICEKTEKKGRIN